MQSQAEIEKAEKPDLCLFTDGSGHMDGMGGWCCAVTDGARSFFEYATGSSSKSSVDSMEFTALLEGLDLCEAIVLATPMFGRRSHLGARPKILWRSDRESLVLSVKGDYKRSNLPSLWQRFSYYEKLFKIVPVHVPREAEAELPEFRFCDLHASTQREILKGYVPTITTVV